jgi:Papain fold toxin 2
MAKPPASVAAAQRLAGSIARRYTTFECVECARDIVRALGRTADAEVIKLLTSDRSAVIGLTARDVQISQTGHHVGVRVGDLVFDNLHPDGVPAAAWVGEFLAGTGVPLDRHARAIATFFGRRFLRKQFDQFASSRRQTGDPHGLNS